MNAPVAAASLVPWPTSGPATRRSPPHHALSPGGRAPAEVPHPRRDRAGRVHHRGQRQRCPGSGSRPALLPGLFAVVTAGVLHPAAIAGLAYVAGTLGTLAGADLANLRKVRHLGAPVASIGGAGTFDDVFLAGILAVLLAGLI